MKVWRDEKNLHTSTRPHVHTSTLPYLSATIIHSHIDEGTMPSKVQSILLGGVSMGVAVAIFNFIPVVGGVLCCVAVIGAGVLAVWHYTNTYHLTITGGAGAGMGVLAAIVAAVVSSLLNALFTLVGLAPGWGEMREQMMEGMQRGAGDPEQMETFRQLFESVWFVPGIILCSIVIYALLGAIGGAIGAASFKQGGDTPAAETPPDRSPLPDRTPPDPSPPPDDRDVPPEQRTPPPPAR